MNGSADRVAMSVLRQLIDIDAVDLAVVQQAEPVGNQHPSLPDQFAHFQLTCRASGLGDHVDVLAIDKIQRLGVGRAYRGNGDGFGRNPVLKRIP
jgi:hypothetical protein